jgi:hypothetical protein
MIRAQPGGRTLAAVLERSDYWRRSPASAGGPSGHKEWHYFCALGEDIDLIANLSLSDRRSLQAGAPSVIEDACVILLARTADGRWHGDAEACDPTTVLVQAGRVNARFGASRVVLRDGVYRLDSCVRAHQVTASLELRPTARPALTRTVPLGLHEAMHWLVVPRLDASGEVRVGNAVFRLQGAPAYHDHNWGRFAWGGDFAWEWGVALSGRSDGWSLIYYRITDRARHKSLSQGVLLWHGDRHCRTFRDGDVSIHSSDLVVLGRCLRVPRIMSLAIPGTVADIPRRLEVAARGGNDRIEIVLDLEDGAQIGLPDESGDRMTLISECRGRLRASGRIRGAPVHVDAPLLIEFNRAA